MTIIAVHVTPRSSKDAILGLENDEVRVKVTAPPDDGKANKAVCKLVAKELGIPKSAVNVASGQTSRHKRLSIEADEARVRVWYEALPTL